MANGGFSMHDGSSAYSDEPDELNEHVQDPGDPDGVIADEKRQHWQETHPSPQRTPKAAYRPKRLWPRIIIVMVILVAAAFGAYWLGSMQAAKKQAEHPPVSRSKSDQQANANQVATATTHYDSSTFTLGFDYPQTWVVNDTPAKLTVTSPTMQLTTGTGSKTSVEVVVIIENQQATISGFPANGAVAALTSDHLTYKQPSSIQRAQTYLSYLSYTGSTDLDAMYITGDNGYQQGQDVPMSDIVKGNPLLSVSFNACPDENCTTGKPVTLNAHDWKSTGANKDVANLIKSLVLED